MRYVLTRGNSSGETLGELGFFFVFLRGNDGEDGIFVQSSSPQPRPPDLVFALGTLISLNRFALLLVFLLESTSNRTLWRMWP